MTDAVFDFKSIARKLNRQEQKAEFEAKNPPEPSMYGWPYGVAVPFVWRQLNAEPVEYAISHGQHGDTILLSPDGMYLRREIKI